MWEERQLCGPWPADTIGTAGDRSATVRAFLRWFFFLIPCSLVLSIACGAGGVEDDPEGTPTPVPTPVDFDAIRNIDFDALPETQALLTRLGGGQVAVDEVLFADLTGDMREEAIVPITSGGTLGNLAYLIFALRSGEAEVILTRTMDRGTPSGLVMGIDDLGALTETAGVYANEDPLCCPSQLRFTTFRWDGAMLQVGGEVRRENPDRPKQ